MQKKNIQTAEVTLHVGIGTFRPVEVSDIETHQMHQERIEVPAATVEKIQQTKANGGRVIAVGTTSTRALEGAAAISGKLQPYNGKTELFIYPGYQWRVIDGLITNFHLPGSSLMMMVSALIGAGAAASPLRSRYPKRISFLLIWGCHVDSAGGNFKPPNDSPMIFLRYFFDISSFWPVWASRLS